MQASFFKQVADSLSVERLDAYASDKPGPCITLARYLWNVALCESLYSPLQLCEVALRNAVHRRLTAIMSREDWYDARSFTLTDWAACEVGNAKEKIRKARHTVTPGRVVAELHFGFWTSLFEDHYERNTPFLPRGIKAVFPWLPKEQHNRKQQKRTLEEIRTLRNRVFHHERIAHWRDLETRHADILSVIGWISPELQEMAVALDRFSEIRKQGLDPWIAKIRHHWPQA